MRETIERYDDIIIKSIIDQDVNQWDESKCTHIKVTLPAESNSEYRMASRGFILADRTLGVSINVNRNIANHEKLVRLDIDCTSNEKKEIFEIAKRSFPYDRRFHLTPEINSSLAEKVISTWIDAMDEAYVCRYRDKVVGFLQLIEVNKTTCFIRLAAIDAQYKALGVALSLYANAIVEAKKKGYKKIEGRISTRNMPVMNLYSFLGASFNEPENIYLKEV